MLLKLTSRQILPKRALPIQKHGKRVKPTDLKDTVVQLTKFDQYYIVLVYYSLKRGVDYLRE